MTISGSATLVTVASFSGGNHVAIEIKLPGTNPDPFDYTAGTATGWLDVIKPFQTATWTDGSGCYSASLGNDTTIPTTDLGLTVGTKSTASTGDRIYFRIRAGASWTGYLTGISIEWNAS